MLVPGFGTRDANVFFAIAARLQRQSLTACDKYSDIRAKSVRPAVWKMHRHGSEREDVDMIGNVSELRHRLFAPARIAKPLAFKSLG